MGTLLHLFMRSPVQFDDQPRGDANEVPDIGADGHLTPELRADAAISQRAPQHRLGNRHLAAELPRMRELMIGEAPHAKP